MASFSYIKGNLPHRSDGKADVDVEDDKCGVLVGAAPVNKEGGHSQ